MKCPKCESEKTVLGDFEYQGENVVHTFDCNSCTCTFNKIYKLIETEIVEETSVHENDERTN